MNATATGIPFLSLSFRTLLAAVAAMSLVLLQSGCVSFTIDDAGASPNKTTTTGIETASNAVNEIDEVEPEVSRSASGHVRLGFNLIGSMTLTETTRTTIWHSAGQRLAFGFFPGAAPDKEAGEAVGTAFMSIWYNVLFAGMPTVSGLFIEPFISADSEKRSRFSRSALFGFHKWKGQSRLETKDDSKRMAKETYPLQNFRCEISGLGGADNRREATETSYVFFDVPDGVKSISVRLEIPFFHPLKKQLAPFEKTTFKIAIPER